MPLVTGAVLNNRYRIVSLLGQGGFGAVYRAWDLNLGQPCAVKENLESTPAARRQFEIEARLVSKLRHPNLPVVIDHCILPGQGQYLVMDFIEGEDLQAKLDRAGGPLPEDQVVDWIAQVSAALAYLHEQEPPVIHRDVKPKNIIITPKGRTMLVDFGISKVFDPAASTTAGARGYTPGYSPPEQYGGGTTGPYSDVYALGATLYALLTGEVPPTATDRAAGQAVVRPAAELNPAVSPQLNALIASALQMEARRRCPSAAGFRAALLAPSPAPRQPAPVGISPARKSGGRLWALGAVVLLAPVLVWLGVIGSSKQTDSRRATQTAAELALRATGTEESGSTRAAESERAVRAAGTPAAAATLTARPTGTPAPSRTPTAAAEPGPGATRVAPVDGMVQVYVPAGEFLMGSTDADGDAAFNEKPQHPVYLDAFWIDRTEVTNGMFAQCVAAGSCQSPLHTSSYNRISYYGDPQYTDYPVIWVSWEDARSYCAWAGRALPSEAQWEKAARGEDGRLYPWGNAQPDCALASFDQCSGGDTQAVGSYPEGASPYGALDMAGNAWEWAADWYDENYYGRSPSSNPTGLETGTYRALRGGGWLNYWYYLRSAYRYNADPAGRSDTVGFRCGSPSGK